MAKNSIYNILYRIANLLFPLITSSYVARVLLENGVGQVAYAQNIASYFVAFASCGMTDYGLREIARVQQNPSSKNQLFTQLMFLNLLITVIAVLSYLVCVFHFSADQQDLKLLLICGLPIVFNAINVDWFYRGNEEYGYIAIRSILVKCVLMFAIFGFVRDMQDYLVYAFLVGLATGGNYVFNLFHLRGRVQIDFTRFEIKKHLSPLIVITLCALLGTIYSKTDITMLGMMESASSVGYYAYAHRTIDVIITFSIAMTSVFLPRLSYNYHHDREHFFELLDTGTRIITFLSIPACVGVILLAPEIMELLYGQAFIPSAKALQIFAILLIIKSYGDLLCYQLALCTGNEKKRIPAYFLAAVSNVILNYILIPKWSFIGATIASVVSELIVNGYQLMKMRGEVAFSLDKKAVMQAIVASIIMSVVVITTKRQMQTLAAKCILSVFMGCVVYVIANIVMKNSFLEIALKKIRKIAGR